MIIIVSTSKNYHKYLHPFFELFKKYWPDCPYRTVVVSDSTVPEEFGDLRFDISCEWGERIKRTLIILSPFVGGSDVLYLQEDYFFTKPPQPIEGLIGLYDYLRLVPYPAPFQTPDQLGIGRIFPQEMYLNSLQASIWRSEYFQSQLRDDDTPWTFEQRNTVTGTHACTIDRKIMYLPRTGVVKGTLTEEAIELLQKEGIELP